MTKKRELEKQIKELEERVKKLEDDQFVDARSPYVYQPVLPSVWCEESKRVPSDWVTTTDGGDWATFKISDVTWVLQ